MFELITHNQFKKDAKRYHNDKSAQQCILNVIDLLMTGEPLPPHYKEHKLIGDYIGYLECHGKPDLLLIYQRDRQRKQIKLYRVGSHSHLFK
ncbi:type II toxin-antitoxin system YafQ family toxin [Muribacter muris]|uniref:Type II toxin-antitoxin system YafQ family toxin n=1 Tax=Muribacter muris TaxID=67855 RepID=A0A4Y9K1E6_9PAST|nr:type II toxin-antitoxin system YafQ family toxin [Muribacter muris]MBF0784636.1 type II toxin-antitoxin system YafQ family toxin [Muribacter muris]MBF0828164.1 type II toxin-antitoxin system YafQ family toxin [Muribacter muris]TFV11911.1 type II toxin-antitoxin system YafQ family toxin [Muribacter muris]